MFKDFVLRQASLCLLSYFIKPLEASTSQSVIKINEENRLKERKKRVEDATLQASSFYRRKAFVAQHRFSFHVDSLFQEVVRQALSYVHECVPRARVAHIFALINNHEAMR